MHTHYAPSGAAMHHNGDYSGDVKLYLPVHDTVTYADEAYATAPQRIPGAIGEHVEVHIPFADMLSIVMSCFAAEKISQLEQMTPQELVKEFLR